MMASILEIFDCCTFKSVFAAIKALLSLKKFFDDTNGLINLLQLLSNCWISVFHVLSCKQPVPIYILGNLVIVKDFVWLIWGLIVHIGRDLEREKAELGVAVIESVISRKPEAHANHFRCLLILASLVSHLDLPLYDEMLSEIYSYLLDNFFSAG